MENDAGPTYVCSEYSNDAFQEEKDDMQWAIVSPA